MTKAVSLLMCTNNFDEAFKAAVRSCLNQSFEDLELVIVVNCVDEKIQEKIRYFYEDEKENTSENISVGVKYSLVTERLQLRRTTRNTRPRTQIYGGHSLHKQHVLRRGSTSSRGQCGEH